METATALLAFSMAATLLTITPGLDTALVLRTAAVEGARPALSAGAGIAAGSLAWGCLTGLGLSALLAVSETGYLILKIGGAAYLFYLGIGMLRSALFNRHGMPLADETAPVGRSSLGWFLRGLMTNLLNPKVGVFYVSFLPQFIPAGANVAFFSVAMAAIHALLGIGWFGVLILATRPLSRFLRKPGVFRALDGITGGILIAFGVKLALDRRVA